MEDEEAGRLGLDLIAHIPQEQVTCLHTTLPILRSEKLCIEMCNLSHLQLDGVDLSTFFTGPGVYGPHISRDALRSLDHIVIIRPTQASVFYRVETTMAGAEAKIDNGWPMNVERR